MEPKRVNIPIATFYSDGYPRLKLSTYLNRLVFDFAPSPGEGASLYSHLSTTIGIEEAAYFYLVAMSIFRKGDASGKVDSTVQCTNNTSLSLYYMPDDYGRMYAHLTIRKGERIIHFNFHTMSKDVMLDGCFKREEVQADLGVFAMKLLGYIIDREETDYLKKVLEDGLIP